jgi:DNA-binding FadR family transcriptional regulator
MDMMENLLEGDDAAELTQRAPLALSRLRRLIAEGIAEEDGRLPPERHLAERLGVGRRSLRRALGVLEEEGHIWRRQGKGTFVRDAKAPFDLHLGRISQHTNPIEVMEMRLALEPVAARLAALRASRCDLDRLRRLAEETRSARRASDYERADTAFHRRIAEAARNALCLALYDAMADLLRGLACERLTENGRCFNRQAVYADFHDQLVEAIAARDGDRAEKIMYAHLRDVQQNILARAFPLYDVAE